VAREQIRKLEGERTKAMAQAEEMGAEGNEPVHQVVKLAKLKGIGPVSSWMFVMEVFGWRKFKNSKKVGGYSGMTGTPYDSGESQREQGISKAGNRRMRKMAVEIGWSWLRFQPNSELSRWFHERYANGGKRMRRIGIVALARKLLVVLWRYLEKGVIPKGAEFKAAT
jgi:transposase